MNIALSLLWMMSLPPTAHTREDREYVVRVIRTAAMNAKVPAGIALQLADAESGFTPYAVHIDADGNRDFGLYQLSERYMQYFTDRFNEGNEILVFSARPNAKVALRYLHSLYGFTGNWHDALAAYNCGLACVMGGDVPEATRRYVERIMAPGTEVTP